MFNRLGLYFNTLKYLSPLQVYHYVHVYFLRKGRMRIPRSHPFGKPSTLSGSSFVKAERSWYDGEFRFLNRSVGFKGVDKIDWNYAAEGKLFTYNLNYFDFLHQEGMSAEQGLAFIHAYLDKTEQIRDGWEPYCISVRCLNWINFLSCHGIDDERINNSLGQQFVLLARQLEYHLRANHLLENAFALTLGGLFFKSQLLFEKGAFLLQRELDEQIVKDGGHFERSPMYHALLLKRNLELIHIMRPNADRLKNVKNLLLLLESKASLMINWLNAMTIHDAYPAFHDSTNVAHIRPSQLFAYAQELGILPGTMSLNVSGFRRYSYETLTLFCDVAGILADYQPGHYHASIFSLVCYQGSRPILVDTGISTYANSLTRTNERSTAAHNTVSINGMNQSEVWSAFRVANRARVVYLRDTDHDFIAYHDGYKKQHAIHYFSSKKISNGFEFNHRVEGKVDKMNLYLHIHPDCDVTLLGSKIMLNDLEMHVTNAIEIQVETYQFADDWNRTRPARRLNIHFRGECGLSLTTVSH